MEGWCDRCFASRVATLQTPVWRTAQLAASAGCSPQLVRNLERDGVLPPAPRTSTGYRQYGHRHLVLLLAYQAFATALGPAEAKALLRAFEPRRSQVTLIAVDRAHALLHLERERLAAARSAARDIAAEPLTGSGCQDWMGVAELAEALGVRPSTLRYWETQGLVVPERWSSRRIRTYAPPAVRDARIVAQLRLAGHRIDAIRALLPDLRTPRHRGRLDETLLGREAQLLVRSRALLRAAHHLHLLLAEDDGAAEPVDQEEVPPPHEGRA